MALTVHRRMIAPHSHSRDDTFTALLRKSSGRSSTGDISLNQHALFEALCEATKHIQLPFSWGLQWERDELVSTRHYAVKKEPFRMV